MSALDKALAVLRISCAGQGDNEFLDKAEAELRRLHAVNAELLAALKGLLNSDDWERRDACTAARTAIAKAEGK
jgi:hypothetical protein